MPVVVVVAANNADNFMAARAVTVVVDMDAHKVVQPIPVVVVAERKTATDLVAVLA